MNAFISSCIPLGAVELPDFTATRIMMMPVIIGDPDSLPDFVGQYRQTMASLSPFAHKGQVGYLTVDEKEVLPGKTHRRAGLHVDGVYKGHCGSWGGGGGGWGSKGNGMITVASHVGCRAWNQEFSGLAGYDGECDHMIEQLRPEAEVVFQAGHAYWVDGLCVHESIPQTAVVLRQFVRLSMPSDAPWFDGYTVNPLGVMPTGPVLARREFMETK